MREHRKIMIVKGGVTLKYLAIGNFFSRFKNSTQQACVRFATGFAVVLLASQSSAFEFNLGEWRGYMDTTFTASAAMRVEGNTEFGTAPPTGRTYIFKDPGDVYSTPLSLLTDIGISKGNFGAFARAAYVYDPTILGKDCDTCFRPNSYAHTPGMVFPGTLTPVVDPAYNFAPFESQFHDPALLGGPNPLLYPVDGIDDKAQKLAGNRFNLLDLFVYGGWDLWGHPLNVRVGKQVINWGESNIQGGGIAQMQNPRDLSKATTPGTDVKETLIPQESVYFNFGFTDNISLEAYYTWNWRESTFIGVGTYFSPFDFLGAGYNPDLFVRGIEKSGKSEPENGGQWGINMHFVIPSWNYADLGIYWVRSHAHSPYIGLNENYVPRPDPARPGAMTLAGYQWIYPEDQDTYAISLNGEGPFDTSFAVEFNLKEKFYDTRECRNLFGIGGIGVPDLGGIPVSAIFGFPLAGQGGVGTQGVTPGCDVGASNVYTFLGNLTKSAGTDLFGADKINLVFDMAAVWIPELHFDGGAAAGGRDRVNASATSPTGQSTHIGDPGFFKGVDGLDRPLTEFSWGYTAVMGLEYPNLFWNLTVKPTVIFVHHVEGYTPFQGGAMVENQRTIVSKLTFDYQSQTSVDLQYVTWLGTAGTNASRDNVSITFKYSF